MRRSSNWHMNVRMQGPAAGAADTARNGCAPGLGALLIGYADSVLEDGGAVLVYRDLELGGEGGRLGEFVT
jgi:hypothetical protein